MKDAIEEYRKRLSKYTNIELIELKDESIGEKQKILFLEGEKIKKHLNDKDYIITLEIEGQQLTSISLAEKMQSILVNNSNLTFIIGGSYGLSEEIKNLANFHLSFSKLTFPHQLFRVLLLEQIYRSYKINSHESYHK